MATEREQKYPARDLTRLDWSILRAAVQEFEENHRAEGDQAVRFIRETWGKVNTVFERLGPPVTKQVYVTLLPQEKGADVIVWGYRNGMIQSIESRFTHDPDKSLARQVMTYYEDKWLVTKSEDQLDGYICVIDLEERTAP